jgi:hypothetical protein
MQVQLASLNFNIHHQRHNIWECDKYLEFCEMVVLSNE